MLIIGSRKKWPQLAVMNDIMKEQDLPRHVMRSEILSSGLE